MSQDSAGASASVADEAGAYSPVAGAAGAVRYPQLLRIEPSPWWRAVVGLLLAGTTLVTGAVAVILAALVAGVLSGAEGDAAAEDSLSPDTPLGLLANNLVIAMLIPASVLAVVVVHRAPAGALASVLGRPRWWLLGRCFLLAVVVVGLFFAAGFLLPEVATDGGSDPSTVSTRTLVGLLAVIALSTPVQAAAEEVGFRGYLSQAVATWFSRPRAGTVVAAGVSATVFALAHGVQDPPLFADRLAFGLVASWLVWRTGGLEAAVALHVANNLVSLGFTALTGSLEDALTASSLPWEYAVLDVTMMVAFAAVVHVASRRWQVVGRRDPPPAALSAPADVGYRGRASSAPPPAGNEHPWGMG